MKPFLLHHDAREELDAAVEFYENRTRGLGLDLLTEVEKAIAEIQRRPGAWPRYKQTRFRRYLVERFPFAIYYLDFPDCTWVAAVAHGSRRPDYWKERKRR